MTLTPVEMENADSTPIMVGISKNEIMGRWEISIAIGNFKTEHSAQAAARKFVKFVEREFGFKPAKIAARN